MSSESFSEPPAETGGSGFTTPSEMSGVAACISPVDTDEREAFDLEG